MAIPEHVAPFRVGLEEARDFVQELGSYNLDLSGADLSGLDVSGLDLSGADLSNTNFAGARCWATVFDDADCSGTNFSEAVMVDSSFSAANCCRANFMEARLGGVNFFTTNLDDATLAYSTLEFAVFDGSSLNATTFTGAFISNTKFCFLNLNTAIGLNEAAHDGPSVVEWSTLQNSRNVPTTFWQGVGLPERLLEYVPSLQDNPIQYYSCFISYSTADEDFAKRLHADLQAQGVRCWFAPEDLKIGDPFRKRIDEAIRVHDKILIILSKTSISSAWVETEVETAFEKERRKNRMVLFPIQIDGVIMESDEAWASNIRRTRHIGNFSGWKDHDYYRAAFERLMRDLRSEEEK